MEVEKRLEKKLQHWEDSDEKAQLEETRAYKNSNLSMEYYQQMDQKVVEWKKNYRFLVEH